MGKAIDLRSYPSPWLPSLLAGKRPGFPAVFARVPMTNASKKIFFFRPDLKSTHSPWVSEDDHLLETSS